MSRRNRVLVSGREPDVKKKGGVDVRGTRASYQIDDQRFLYKKGKVAKALTGQAFFASKYEPHITLVGGMELRPFLENQNLGQIPVDILNGIATTDLAIPSSIAVVGLDMYGKGSNILAISVEDPHLMERRAEVLGRLACVMGVSLAKLEETEYRPHVTIGKLSRRSEITAKILDNASELLPNTVRLPELRIDIFPRG